MYNKIESSVSFSVREDNKLEVHCHDLTLVSNEKVTEETNKKTLAIAMVYDALESLKKEGIIPEWAIEHHSQLVSYSFAVNKETGETIYFLTMKDGVSYEDEKGNIVMVSKEEMLALAMLKNLPYNEEFLAKVLFRFYCQAYDLIFVEPDVLKEITKMYMHEEILNEEHLLSYFLNEKQDFTNASWSDPMRKNLYLKTISNGWDLESSNNYVSVCERLGRNLDFRTYETIMYALTDAGYSVKNFPLGYIEDLYCRNYTLKFVEDECGEEYYTICSYADKDVMSAFVNMAAKYATMPIDFIEMLENMDNTQEILEELNQYDEHWKDMAEYRSSCNGQDAFIYYMETYCGCKMKPLTPEFDCEW